MLLSRFAWGIGGQWKWKGEISFGLFSALFTVILTVEDTLSSMHISGTISSLQWFDVDWPRDRCESVARSGGGGAI